MLENALKAHVVEIRDQLPAAITTFMRPRKTRCERWAPRSISFTPTYFSPARPLTPVDTAHRLRQSMQLVRDNWRIPAITAMHEDNPGTREIGRHVFVLQTGASAASMQETSKRYSLLVERLIARDQKAVEDFRAEYCLTIPRRFTISDRQAGLYPRHGSLLARLSGQSYESEIPRIETQAHAIPNLTVSLADATVALVTEGGLVPKGNPDRLESSRGSRYFKYSVQGRNDLKHGEFEAMHTGYDTSTVDRDPDRLVPSMPCAYWKAVQRIKKVHDQYFVTTGTGAMPSKMAELGAGIAAEIAGAGIDAVILTAT